MVVSLNKLRCCSTWPTDFRAIPLSQLFATPFDLSDHSYHIPLDSTSVIPADELIGIGIRWRSFCIIWTWNNNNNNNGNWQLLANLTWYNPLRENIMTAMIKFRTSWDCSQWTDKCANGGFLVLLEM